MEGDYQDFCPTTPDTEISVRSHEISWSFTNIQMVFWSVIGLSQLLIVVMLLVIFAMVKKNSQDVKELRKDNQLPNPSGMDSSTEDVSSSDVTEVTNSEDQPEVKTDQDIVTETIESSPEEEPDAVSQESKNKAGDGLEPGKSVSMSPEGAAPARFTFKEDVSSSDVTVVTNYEDFIVTEIVESSSQEEPDAVSQESRKEAGDGPSESVSTEGAAPFTFKGFNNNNNSGQSNTMKFESSGNGLGRFEKIEEKKGSIFGCLTNEPMFLPLVPTFSATASRTEKFQFKSADLPMSATENKGRMITHGGGVFGSGQFTTKSVFSTPSPTTSGGVFGCPTNNTWSAPTPTFSTKSVFSSTPSSTTLDFKFTDISTESKTREANINSDKSQFKSADLSNTSKFKSSGNGSGRFERNEEMKGGVFGFHPVVTTKSSTQSPTISTFKFIDTSTKSKSIIWGATKNNKNNSDKLQFKSADLSNTSKLKSSGNGSGRFERIEEKKGGIFGFQTKDSVVLPSVPTSSATVVTTKSVLSSNSCPTISAFKFTSTESKTRGANTAASSTPSFSVDFMIV